MGRILSAFSATFVGIFILSLGCYAFSCMAYQGFGVESVAASSAVEQVQTLAANR